MSTLLNALATALLLTVLAVVLEAGMIRMSRRDNDCDDW